MKIKEIISILSEKNNFSKTLLEKDLIIHLILLHLSKNKDFKEKYAFKGGTCLIKAYFDYYRFSEDLDFTFINQHLFKNKSKKQIRKLISKELDLIINLLNDFHKDLIFEPDKSNKKFFEFGAGNIFTTIKMYYKSIETKKESFIKLQFNFMEQLFYPIKIMKLNSI
ncbi:MAG: nucleotidyl transferase AbiEii/AbiGii toxin family protein, partial [Candidatus Woesearchaeota archaeon]